VTHVAILVFLNAPQVTLVEQCQRCKTQTVATTVSVLALIMLKHWQVAAV
jgi:hypothetical protein